MKTTLYIDQVNCDVCVSAMVRILEKSVWIKDVVVNNKEGTVLIISESEDILDRLKELKESLKSIIPFQNGSHHRKFDNFMLNTLNFRLN